MWLMWGFISFLVVMFVTLYRKLYVSWSPDERKPDRDWQYKNITHKGEVVSVLLGIEGIHQYRFSFKRESSIHGFGKWCGLAREFQTGDADFDSLVYILSDNSLLHRKLAASSEVRSAISAIFKFGINHLATVEELICADGKLWVVLKVGSSYGLGTIDNVARALIPKLNLIKQEVNNMSPRDITLWRDPVFLKAMVMFSVSSGLAINGGMHLMRTYYIAMPFLVDAAEIIKAAIILGLGVCVLLGLAALYFIGRSARTHLVIFEIVTMGLFGAIATSFVELRDFNMETDLSRPEAVVADVQSTYSKRGRKSGTKYYVVVRDWRCDCGDLTKQVPYDVYTQLRRSDKAELLQHKGALGYAWVSKVRAYNEN